MISLALTAINLSCTLSHLNSIKFEDAKRIYDEIKSLMNETLDTSNLIELKCDKVQDKLIAVRAKEVISVPVSYTHLTLPTIITV